jgi:hypothetical protein
MTLSGRPIDFCMADTSSCGVPPGKSKSNLVSVVFCDDSWGAGVASVWADAGVRSARIRQVVARIAEGDRFILFCWGLTDTRRPTASPSKFVKEYEIDGFMMAVQWGFGNDILLHGTGIRADAVQLVFQN